MITPISKADWINFHFNFFTKKIFVGLNLINHVLALFHDKFACNIALRNLVFR